MRISRMIGVWIQNIAGLLVIATCVLIIFCQYNQGLPSTIIQLTRPMILTESLINSEPSEEVIPDTDIIRGLSSTGMISVSDGVKTSLMKLSDRDESSRKTDAQNESDILNMPSKIKIVDPKIDEELLLGRIQKYIRVHNDKLPEEIVITLSKSIVQYGTEMQLPIELVIAVAQTESSFNPQAKGNLVEVKGHGKVSALGPMQVIWEYHAGLLKNMGFEESEELLDPNKGIQAGCMILKRYIDAQESITGGLGKYYGVLSPQYIGKVISNYLTAATVLSGHLDESGIRRSNNVEKTNIQYLTEAGAKMSSTPSPPRQITSYGSKHSINKSDNIPITVTSSPSKPQSGSGLSIWAGKDVTVIR